MDLFFKLVTLFALFFGIGGLVYATEVSKRCQLMIEERMTNAEADLARQIRKQDILIEGALQGLRRTVISLEESELAQTREINILRKVLEPMAREFEEAQEQKQKKIAANRR
ncbi:MAG: hypothetical protein WD075_10635 [Rhodospirillales bacterium]